MTTSKLFYFLLINLLYSGFAQCSFFNSAAFQFPRNVFFSSFFVVGGTIISYTPLCGIYALKEIISKKPQNPRLSAIKPSVIFGGGFTTLLLDATMIYFSKTLIHPDQSALQYIKAHKPNLSGLLTGTIVTTYGLLKLSNWLSKRYMNDKNDS